MLPAREEHRWAGHDRIRQTMHFNFDFTAVQILWTLTFAALLVLLVVLIGRDRLRRFPWFTASIVLAAMRLLMSRLLYGKMPPLTLNMIFITMADLIAIVGFLVLAELARKAFSGARRGTWILWALAMLATGAGMLSVWGPWPAWKTVTVDSQIAVLQLMQLVAQKGDLLVSVLTVELGLLAVIFGRRYHAGWRSHVQQILIGLSTVAIAQLAVQGMWQLIAMKASPQSEAEYERILGLRDKLYNGGGAVFAVVVVWWIACLWIDEPRAAQALVTPEVESDDVPREGRAEGEAGSVDGAEI
jgi:asparagine N-glycosylation enzyme membrane subunit Stt3